MGGQFVGLLGTLAPVRPMENEGIRAQATG